MKYVRIDKDNMNNGEGIRVILWVAGCSHHCSGCHNPETWNPDNWYLFTNVEKNILFEELSKDYVDGITFSGGDPFYKDNKEEILLLCKEIKEKFPTKTIWLYTGNTIESLKGLNDIDVIIDGEFKKELRATPYPKWRGSWNQRIIKKN